MTGGSFSSIYHLIAKLWSSKFRELDACGRPLFANPVTYERSMDNRLIPGKESVATI